MGILMDTAGYPRAEQLDAWGQILTDYLVPFRVAPAPEIPFRGQLRYSQLGPVDMVAATCTASVNHRPQRLVAVNTRLAVSLHLAGDWVVSEDRSQQRLQPGDLVLWDLTRPKTLALSTSVSTLNFRMPPEVLGLRTERLLTSAATVLPTGSGLGTLITPYLRRLAGLAAGGLRPDVAARLGMTTADLLASYFADLLGEVTGIDGADQRTLPHRTKAHIEDHLGEPDLNPATIAAAHNISVRLLYKVFATEGHTVAAWIRQRRLDRIRHDLIHPAHTNVSITAVACRWGFTDSAHFSRTFKAAFGTSPSDYRRSNTPLPADAVLAQ